MPNRSLRDFMPLVLPYAPGCPMPTAVQALRMAAIDWCERTRCWRSVTTVTIAAQGQAIVAPDYAAIFEIETAHFNGIELTPTQFSDVDPEYADTDTETGTPRYVTQASPNTVTILPFAEGELRMSLFLKPRSGPEFGTNGAGGHLHLDQNVVPEHVFVQDAEAIAAGALYRIQTIPNQPFSDPKMAGVNMAIFNDKADNRFQSHVEGQQRYRKRSRGSWL